MARYFILIKRQGSKKWLGAIPARAGVSLAKLRTNVRKFIKKGFSYKIITISQLKRLLPKRKTMPKKRTKRRVKRTRRKTQKVRRKRRK